MPRERVVFFDNNGKVVEVNTLNGSQTAITLEFGEGSLGITAAGSEPDQFNTRQAQTLNRFINGLQNLGSSIRGYQVLRSDEKVEDGNYGKKTR